MRRYVSCFVIVGCLVVQDGKAAAEKRWDPMRWIANAPLQIKVALYEEEAEAIGLSRKFLLDTTELALRRNRVSVQSPDDAGPPLAILSVTAHPLKIERKAHGYVWHIEVEALHHACSRLNHVYPVAWAQAGMGYCLGGTRDGCDTAYLRRSVGRILTAIIDKFSLAYLKAGDGALDFSGLELVPVCLAR